MTAQELFNQTLETHYEDCDRPDCEPDNILFELLQAAQEDGHMAECCECGGQHLKAVVVDIDGTNLIDSDICQDCERLQ